MHSRDSQAGFTIIEVLVTALIVAVMSTGIAMALVSAAGASGDQRSRAEADAIAAQDQERMRGLSDAQLVALGSAGKSYTPTASETDGTDESDGTQFTVTSSATAVTDKGVSSCTAGGASDFEITSTVKWTDPSGTSQDHVTVESLMARPTTGDLIALIDDQAGNPLRGVSVIASAQGVASESATTDNSGCTVFAGLTPGPYTVAYSDPGYVTQEGVLDPTSVTVNAIGTPSLTPYYLGLGGTIQASFLTVPAKLGDPVYTGEATSLSYAGVGGGHTVESTQTTPTTPAMPGAATSSVTTPLLYPWDVTSPPSTPSYQNNYTVWAGACAAQEPPAGTYVATASVSPGAKLAPTVDEPLLKLPKVTYKGSPVTPTALELTFASQGATSCTDSWTAPVATPQSANTPPGTGWLADPGQPYADGTSGTLTVCASYTKGAATVSGSTTATNANFTSINSTGTIPLTQTGGCS